MVKYNTSTLTPESMAKLPKTHILWLYNGLDSALTYEVHGAISKLHDDVTRKTYQFSLEIQAPVLAMMRRGVRVDQWARGKAIADLEKKADFLQVRLDAMAWAVWDKGLNPNSPKQCCAFFYECLRLPMQRKLNKKTGERNPTVDRNALETLQNYFQASIFVTHIMAIRELRDLAATVKAKMDADGRMRTTFNIAGTETGRFSSSEAFSDTGTNLQNQTEEVRRIYVADQGYKLGVFDLKTGESFAVGLRCKILGLGDAYLRACSGGDLHTHASRLVWPNLPWTGGAGDRAVAESQFYRHFTYRDMAKRGGHGTNYYGSPWTMAKHLKVDKKLMEVFQAAYFEAFPEIKEWHTWVAQQLQTKAQITSLMGRRRHFFGRLRADHTLKEAIAYDPQSSIADYTNQWLLRVYRNVPAAQLLLQGHDALVLQFRERDEAEVVSQVITEAAKVRLGGAHPDSITIPVEAKTGWNWGKVDPKRKLHPDGNPFGLLDYTGKDVREYTEPSLLDRRFS